MVIVVAIIETVIVAQIVVVNDGGQPTSGRRIIYSPICVLCRKRNGIRSAL